MMCWGWHDGGVALRNGRATDRYRELGLPFDAVRSCGG